MITVRPVRRGDADSWCRMRHDLWPDGNAEEHASEIAAFLEDRACEPLAVLVAEEAGGELVGLAELSIRPCAEGCTELASDTAVDNDGSTAAHRAAGFDEVGLVRCFRKLL